MRVNYMSDLHLEFGPMREPLRRGNVLLLPGDILLARDLRYADGHYYGTPGRVDRYKWFFDEADKTHDETLMIGGNHEPYNGVFDDTGDIMRGFFKREGFKARFMERQLCEIGGVEFLATSLWTPMIPYHLPPPISDQDTANWRRWLRGQMNDFAYIQKRVGDSGIDMRTFHPDDAAAEFRQSMAWLQDALPRSNAPAVVMTHHAPTRKACGRRQGSTLSPAYATALESFIAEHPRIKYWVSGHTHEPYEESVGDTLITSNMRGYYGYEECHGFSAKRFFKIGALPKAKVTVKAKKKATAAPKRKPHVFDAPDKRMNSKGARKPKVAGRKPRGQAAKRRMTAAGVPA